MAIHYSCLKSSLLTPYIHALADLRLRVFRDYPYLYDGSLSDELEYLEAYSNSPSSLVTLALDGNVVIGASTCLRLSDADEGFRACFENNGTEISKICYLGESVLLKPYRGRGIGKMFFHYRENHARSLQCSSAAFCSVDRGADHAHKPIDYRPLDGFWETQGYEKHPKLKAHFSWKEVHEDKATPKTLTFWTKALTA